MKLQCNVNSPLVHFSLVQRAEFFAMPDQLEEVITAMGQLHRDPTEDIIHYFTLMSSELHYLDIIPIIENLH